VVVFGIVVDGWCLMGCKATLLFCRDVEKNKELSEYKIIIEEYNKNNISCKELPQKIIKWLKDIGFEKVYGINNEIEIDDVKRVLAKVFVPEEAYVKHNEEYTESIIDLRKLPKDIVFVKLIWV